MTKERREKKEKRDRLLIQIQDGTVERLQKEWLKNNKPKQLGEVYTSDPYKQSEIKGYSR